jgi:MFS family permease
MPEQRSWSNAVLKRVHPAWHNRNFDLILAARAFMSSGRALAGILVPIYLAVEGFSAVELAIYVMVVAAVAAVASTLIGSVSDQVGRRPFLVGVPLVTALAGLTFAFSRSVPVLFTLGALGGLGRGAGAGAGNVGPYLPAESAMITEILPGEYRNAGFGRVSFASSVGALVGGLLALLVPSAHSHGAAAMAIFRDGFIATAVVSAIAGLLAVGLSEPSGVDGQAGRASAAVRRLGWPKMPQRSRWLLYRLWVTNTFNGIGVGMFGPFITYWFYRRFGASASQLGLLFAVINAVTMFSSLSAAGLARRWGLVKAVTLVRVAQAVLIAPMILSPNFLTAGGFYLVRMLVQRIGLPLRQSYTVGLADPAERGAVAALSSMPSQLAMSVSPLATGYLLDEVSLALPFEIAAVFMFLNAASFWALFRGHPPAEERARAAAVTPDEAPAQVPGQEPRPKP